MLGQWLNTSADYDDHDNVIRALDAAAAQAVRANRRLRAHANRRNVTQALYNAEVKDASGKVVLPAGSPVTDTFGRSGTVALTKQRRASRSDKMPASESHHPKPRG